MIAGSVAPEPELEKYEIIEEVGHGGMATVYRARDRRLEREVAIKVIHRHLRENAEVAARFVSEARAVAKLRHPNIVEVYDVSEDSDPERYLVVELVSGTTLRNLLSERECLPAEIAAAVAIEIGNALAHAHSHGVVHRDIKPENVLVSVTRDVDSVPSGSRNSEAPHGKRIKITDFGIAKLLDAQGVTSTGQVLGSPAHMAPEQIEGGDVGAASDVFGLGVLLYECLVGRLPFEGKNPAQVLRRVLDGVFTLPDKARPTVGQHFSAITARALAQEPDDRWESVEAMCEALQGELDKVAMADPSAEIARYLDDPEGFVERYEERVVTRLVELGRQSRKAGEPSVAAGYFNRALAFRPDDTELLAQVAGLARAERNRRLLVRASGAVLAAGLCGTLAYGVTRLSKTSPVPSALTAEPVLTPPTPSPSAPRMAPPVQSGSPNKVTRPVRSAVARVPKLAPSAKPGVPPKGTREVRIVITGAMSTNVSIDGRPVQWFGQVHELGFGPHNFEFLAPEPGCCIVPKRTTRNVVPGEGVQVIPFNVPFRSARVTMNGPAGSKASCPTLFTGELLAGASRQIKPSKAEVDVTCTISGPGDTPPKSSTIKVRAGGSNSLNWP